MIEKVPKPLLSASEWQTFENQRPNVIIAVPPTNWEELYSRSFPMSLDTDEIWMSGDISRKADLVFLKLDMLCQLTLGLIGAKTNAPIFLRLEAILEMSRLSQSSLNECCVFCMHIFSISVWSIIGRGVPKSVKWSVKCWWFVSFCE